MQKSLIIFSFLFISKLTFCQSFPETKKTPTTISKHGISYQDNYTWLENMRSEEVAIWVDKQNDFTKNHDLEVHKSYSLVSKIKEYDSRTTYSLPNRKGKYYYRSYIKDKKKSPSLFLLKDLDAEPVEIVNPTKIYPDKNVVVADYYPSKNSDKLAYKLSVDGSDKNEIRFIDLFKNKDLQDVLKNVKFSTVAWNRDSGVFYKKNSNNDFFAKDSTFQLYYHKIGTIQEEDKLVYDGTKNESTINFFTSKNKLFLIETNKEETKKTYFYASLETDDFKLEKFIDDDRKDFEFINFNNGKIYFSSKEYNWGDVRVFSFLKKDDEKTIIPQIYNHLITQTYFSNDYIICKYKTLGKNYFIFYDYEGQFVRKIDVPIGMDLDYDFFDEDTKDFYFGVHSYVMPFRNFKINIITGDEQPFYSYTNRPKATLFPLNYFETKSITYTSRDNVDIPITIIHKKGLVLDGNNPTLLKAYGGFGVVNSPNYDTGLLYFLEKGGVFAYAEIRGGGEKGEKWHKDGMGLKKMNCFNDFIDAAEFLIKEKYTTSKKLAITGGSQGGLLVGVAMTKRPDLFKVAIPKVGVFDMVRFEKYTIGKYHYDEYGNPKNELDFKNILDYSPLNNIKEDVNYPITLIITSENDDRVPPVHSYKFAAQLQNRTAQKNPIYLKVTKKAGHYGDSSTYEKFLNEKADFYSFLLYHLNE
jgi:prolyl oligopeptidase